MSHLAIVPAAGHSSRMGTDKLLLRWRGRCLVEHLLDAWLASDVDRVFVVTRADNVALQDVLQRHPIELIVPHVPPADMKASVQLALRAAAERLQPTDDACWLLAPADMPLLDSQTVNAVLEQHEPADPQILVPTYRGRRGHPVLFPWPLQHRVFQLGRNQGINRLLEQATVREVAVPTDGCLRDVDVPADFRDLLKQRAPCDKPS